MKENWKIKLLYDGECPLCVKEVNFLLKKDAGRGLIKFIDILEKKTIQLKATILSNE